METDYSANFPVQLFKVSRQLNIQGLLGILEDDQAFDKFIKALYDARNARRVDTNMLSMREIARLEEQQGELL